MSAGKGAASAAPNSTNDRLASALEFARLGCRVVACAGKNPGRLLGRDWQRKATTDESLLRGWFTHWTTANVGVIGDGAVAPVDVDDPAAFARLQREHGRALATPRYLTGGAPGRERLLFQHPGGRLDTKLTDGVQLRIGTLMSVVPPGSHPETGATVEWTVALDEVPLAPLPEGWLARVRRSEREGRSKSEWGAMFTRTFVAGCGETHPAFVAMAGRLVPAVGAQATVELLRCWNRAHCRPPKAEREITDAVAWVARKELRR
jgi:hypothetical protein